MELLLMVVRHGETTLNAKHCFRGDRDVPLNAKGIHQAMRVANRLDKLDFARGISSDRKRAKQTAAVIKKVTGTKFAFTHALRALDVGYFSGKKKTAENEKELEHYLTHPSEAIPGGESLNHFKGRIRPVIHKSIKAARKLGKPILMVAHNSIVHELGDMFHKDHNAVLMEPGGAAAVYLKNGKLKAEAVYRASKPSSANTVS